MSVMLRARSGAIGVVVLALVLAGAPFARAQAQQTPAKKPTVTGQTIEIRGQAPTPQVVTVRPREVPAYTPAGLPSTMMASGSRAWPSMTAGYAITPSNQLAGRLPLDTSAAGLARGGSMVGGVALAGAAANGAAVAGGAAASSAVPGGSAAEIEAMRKELAMRKARLDSLQRALNENASRQNALGAPPAGGAAGAARMSSADSAARASEIEAIRRELSYRMLRLDSLQREVNTLGRKGSGPVKSDTTKKGTSGGKPPRGSR
jgi:hypothetical protein